MKKIILFFTMMLILTVSYNTKAQKSGILQKDHYGAFTGNQWEDFLANKNAGEFEKKSNVKLGDYLNNQVTPFVTKTLKEANIASAVANSTTVNFPEDADVYTQNTAGEWITRKAYPGEKGYFHTPTGLYWLSFSCGNLCAFGPGPKKTPVGSGNLGSNTGNQGLTLNINGQQGSQELSWQTGYAVYSQGRNDRQNDFVVGASLYKMIQDSKECCNGGGQTQGSGYVVMSAPAVQQQPMMQTVQQQRVPLGMTVGGQIIANTIGGILAEGGNRLIYGPQNVRIIGQQFFQYPQIPIGPTGPGLPWNNGTGGPSQGGFSSFSGGVLPYNGGFSAQGSFIQ